LWEKSKRKRETRLMIWKWNVERCVGDAKQSKQALDG
jgi:hypothetical protein